MPLPVKRYDFAPDLFPITVEALHPKTRAIVWTATLELPADVAVLRIPPLARQFGHRVAMRIRFADGTVQEDDPAPVN